jgi:hypothetical protein
VSNIVSIGYPTTALHNRGIRKLLGVSHSETYALAAVIDEKSGQAALVGEFASSGLADVAMREHSKARGGGGSYLLLPPPLPRGRAFATGAPHSYERRRVGVVGAFWKRLDAAPECRHWRARKVVVVARSFGVRYSILGKALRVSRERVRQIEARALRGLSAKHITRRCDRCVSPSSAAL